MEKFNLDHIENLLAYHAFLGEDNALILPMIIEYISEKTFKDSANLYVMELVKKFYENYKTVPTISEVKSYITEEEEVKKFADYLTRCKQIREEEINRRVLLDQVEEFLRQRLIKDILDDAFMKNTAGENLEITDVYTGIDDAMGIKLFDDIGLDLFEDKEEYIEVLTSENTTISTGFHWLDEQLGGGFLAKGSVLYNFVAPSNIGKSNFIKAIACNMSRMGKNVLVVSLEMPRYIYANRFVADLADLSIGNLKENEDEISMFLDNAKGKGYGKIIIKDFATGSLTSGALGSYIRRTEQTKGIKFDAIFVDYPELMKPMKVYGTRYDLTIANLYVEVRALSFFLETPLCVVAQLNRDGYNKENPTMENIGGSIGIVQCSDFCGFLYATDEMKEINQIGMNIGKSRFGPVNKSKRYNINPSTLAISESSLDDVIAPEEMSDTVEEISPEDYFKDIFSMD